jgi:hypothetical protein
MNTPRHAATAFILTALAHTAGAQNAPVPPFDLAYRAWDVVTAMGRHNGDPALSGACGRTFRPFVIPGLRMQSRQEQDEAAAACLEAARRVCADSQLRRSAPLSAKCEEFMPR